MGITRDKSTKIVVRGPLLVSDISNTGWWFFTNPSEKYANVKIGSFPQGSGWKFKKKCLSCHHLEWDGFLSFGVFHFPMDCGRKKGLYRNLPKKKKKTFPFSLPTFFVDKGCWAPNKTPPLLPHVVCSEFQRHPTTKMPDVFFSYQRKNPRLRHSTLANDNRICPFAKACLERSIASVAPSNSYKLIAFSYPAVAKRVWKRPRSSYPRNWT